MAYSGRHRYKTRKEKFAQQTRITRLIFIFAAIAAIVLLFRSRYDIYEWIRLFFY